MYLLSTLDGYQNPNPNDKILNDVKLMNIIELMAY